MFNTARIKLTAWYLLIIFVISLVFSTVIYRMLTIEVERFSATQRLRIEHGLSGPILKRLPPTVDLDLIEETKRRIIWSMVYANGLVLVLSGSLSYFLAGRTLKPIKDMLDEQKRFISDASHELRTPLTALKSSIEVHLRDKKLTLKEAKKLLKNNIEDVDRLKELSDGLLSLSGSEKNNRSTLDEIDLKTVIDEAIKTLSGQMKEKEINIVKKYEKTIIWGSRQSLLKLSTILIDNAIKYSDKKMRVTVSVKRKKKSIQLSVADSGRGIKKDDLPHIFERFYRADESRGEEGYGLGLAIAKKIVKEHRGQVWVNSISGKGSTFFVRLPL